MDKTPHDIFLPYLSGDKVLSERKELQIACLVAKIFGCEKYLLQNKLEQIGNVMEVYYKACATEIMQRQGVIDRFCGEYIISFFGLNGNNADSKNNAINSAIKIYETFGFNTKKSYDIGFGICYGRIIYGNYGNEKRATVTGFGQPIQCALNLAKKGAIVTVCKNIAEEIPVMLTHQSCTAPH